MARAASAENTMLRATGSNARLSADTVSNVMRDEAAGKSSNIHEQKIHWPPRRSGVTATQSASTSHNFTHLLITFPLWLEMIAVRLYFTSLSVGGAVIVLRCDVNICLL